MDFDGVDQYGENSTSIGDTLGGGVLSISVGFWFKADVTTGNDGLLHIGPFVGAQPAFGVKLQGLTLSLISNGAVQAFTLFTDTTSWHYLTATANADGSVLYLDGVEVDTGANPSIDITGDPLIIGGYYSSSYTFDGMMDDLRIYSTALTSNEVAMLCYSTCGMYNPDLYTNAALMAAAHTGEGATFDITYTHTNIVSAYRGDRTGVGNGNSFTNLPDATGNGHDGTGTGTITGAR
jgi:hypothetical protein